MSEALEKLPKRSPALSGIVNPLSGLVVRLRSSSDFFVDRLDGRNPRRRSALARTGRLFYKNLNHPARRPS
jgi:hypothetical protein